MKLNQRLKQVGFATPVTEEPEAEPKVTRAASKARPAAAVDSRPQADPLAGIKQRAQEALFAKLGGKLFRPDMTEDQLHRMVVEEIASVVQSDKAPLSPAERQRLVEEITEDVLEGSVHLTRSSPTRRSARSW